MIKDISIIREHLIGYAEVEMPYKFPINCHVKYITFLRVIIDLSFIIVNNVF